ncbi:MAG TPA: acyltransferase, partial [Longimicrobiaceae bacterium]|nr:acyltransferase [Longimicrobiaceae bacterium]
MSTAEARTPPAQRRVQLDGLRAVAVGLVLVHHFGGPASGFVDLGSIGVHLFFVISGFLITGKLLAGRDAVAAGRTTRAGVLRDYYWRRALRILPIYLLVIAVGAAVGMPNVRADWPWLLTFTGNLRTAQTGHFLGFLAPTWTLNIEEQYYLVWPWIVLGAAAARLPRIVLATVALGPLWRAGATLAGVPAKSVAVFTLSAFDGLGLGALLALRWHDGGGEGARPLPAAAAW